MIISVKRIGELIAKEEKKDLLNVLIENPNSKPLGRYPVEFKGRYPYVIYIQFERIADSVKFIEVGLEDFEKSKILKYLYKKKGGNSPNLSPTSKITEIEKTLSKKVIAWFNILKDKNIVISNNERLFLESIKKQLLLNYNLIVSEVQKYREDIPKKYGFIITLKIKEDDKQMYVGDFPIFRRLFLELSELRDESISSNNKVCSLCGEGKKLVFGNIDTYKFYTIDKRGFISGGFREEDAWKNYPVCSECKLFLEEGKKFIESNLSFKFYGLNYYLIPNFILGFNETPSEILDIFKDASKIISLKERSINSLTDDENEILDNFVNEKDYIGLNFLFLKKMNNAERILLLIEDVLPSTLMKIFDAKFYVDEIFNKEFNFGRIREFYRVSDSNNKNSDLDKYFLEITDKIFRLAKIDYYFLLRFIVKRIQEQFRKGENIHNQVISGLMVLLFLDKLDVISFREVVMEKSYFESVFERFKPIFEDPAKRGIFLVGCLTELLLRKQYADREMKPPFLKNLKGLRMNEKDIKGLLPKIQNKLE